MKYYYYNVFIPENDADTKKDLKKYLAESNSTMRFSIHHRTRHQEQFYLRVPGIDNIKEFKRIMGRINSQIECYLEEDRFLHKVGHYQGEEK